MMKDKDDDMAKLFASLATENYCYLTTIGRVSGNPHEIEIWFGMQDILSLSVIRRRR